MRRKRSEYLFLKSDLFIHQGAPQLGPAAQVVNFDLRTTSILKILSILGCL